MPVGRFKLLAHRGARITSPENTLSAIRRARELGADGLECDVRLTADGEPVLFHDDEVRRVTGEGGRITKLAWREVRRLKVLGAEGVPHLEEALEVMRDWPDGEFYFDLHERSAAMAAALVGRIASAGLLARSFVLDFYSQKRLLLHAKSLNPAVRLSVMPGVPWNTEPSVREASAESLCLGWDGPVTRLLYKGACRVYDVGAALDRVRGQGVAVTAGIANTPEDVLYFLGQGAAGIWTDDLLMARETLWRAKAGRPFCCS